MSIENKLWTFAAKTNWNGHEQEEIKSCYLGKIFFWTEHREIPERPEYSAYHEESSFTSTLEAAKSLVEKNRAKGASWTIKELPAIICNGDKIAAIFSEINTNAPLKQYSTSTFLNNKIFDICNHLIPPKRHSIIRIVCNQNIMQPANIPFKSYNSKSIGGNYYLHWTEHIEYAWEIKPLLDAINKIILIIQPNLGVSIQREGGDQ